MVAESIAIVRKLGAHLSYRGEARIGFPRPGRTPEKGNTVKLKEKGAKTIIIPEHYDVRPCFFPEMGCDLKRYIFY